MPKLTQYLLLALLLHAPLAFATDAVPPLINYQGTLTDENGAPVNGTRRLEFSIYDAPIGGNRVWGPQVFDAVQVIGGRFNVILGSTDQSGRLITSVFDASEKYLALSDGAENQLLTRQQLLSTPFAIRALHGVPTGTVIAYFGSAAPGGWLLCDGSPIPEDNKYDRLRQLIGSNTPDLRGRMILGAGQGEEQTERAVGEIGGEEKHTLTVDELPEHNHGVQLGHNTGHGPDNWGAQHSDPHGGNWGVSDTTNTGAGVPHNNLPPYFTLNYLVKY